MLQTFLGLEYLHAHWILHRVSRPFEAISIDKYTYDVIITA